MLQSLCNFCQVCPVFVQPTYETERLCSVHFYTFSFQSMTLVLFCLHYVLNPVEGAYFGDLFMEPFLGSAFECKLTSGVYNGKVCMLISMDLIGKYVL